MVGAAAVVDNIEGLSSAESDNFRIGPSAPLSEAPRILFLRTAAVIASLNFLGIHI